MTVFLVEDDQHVQTLIKRVLSDVGLNVEAYSSPSELLRAYDTNTPGCLLLDLCLPEMNALELVAMTRESGGHHPFIVISGHSNVRQVVEAIQAGAEDYLEKPFELEALIESVQAALVKDGNIRRERQQSAAIRLRLDSLTPREHEVLQLLLKGKLNKQIASDLGISTKTVDVHRSHVLNKMHVRSVVQLMRLINQDNGKPNLSLP